MTNGEKFQQIFAVSQVDECDMNVYAWLPSHDAIEIPVEWWNAKYSEIPTGSTTKNDLEVDCISRQAVIDLMMQKWGENFSGDDAMQESIDAIRELPSVTPQEPYDKCEVAFKDDNAVSRLSVRDIIYANAYELEYPDGSSEYVVNRDELIKYLMELPPVYSKMVEPQESEG